VLNGQVTGAVLASNAAEFRQHAFAVLDGINRNLQTDQDFSDAEQTGKWCKQVEQKLADTKRHILMQTADIDTCMIADQVNDWLAEADTGELEREGWV